MNSEEIISDQIDQYLNGFMSEDERVIFEEKITQDATLASKVDEARLVNDSIYYATLVDLKNTIGQDIKNIEYKSSPNWKNLSLISVSVVALLSLATYYLTPSTLSEQNQKNQPSLTYISEQENTTTSTNKSVNIEKSSAIEKVKSNQTKPNTNHLPSIVSTDEQTYTPINHDLPVPVVKGQNKKDSSSTIKNVATTNPVAATVVCDKDFKISTTPTCNQKATGQIQIEADKSYAYHFSINQMQQSGYAALFTGLSSGTHDLVITYNKECVYSKKIVVSEKWCGMNDSYSFNPDYNEKWILNYEQGAKGTFVIYDPSGNIIYGDNFGSGSTEWNGIDRQGVTVPAGVYFAFINYSDGRKERVELTIIR